MGFGLFGIIAVSLERIRKEFGWKHVTKTRRKRIEAYLQGEIEELDNYYTGSVYGYEITLEDDDTEVVDSCWGFYGDDAMKEMIKECKLYIDGLSHMVA